MSDRTDTTQAPPTESGGLASRGMMPTGHRRRGLLLSWGDLLRGLLVAGVASLAAPRSAYAYIDPLSGSIVFQVLVAGVLGALLTIRHWWGSLVKAIQAVLARIPGR